MAGLSVIMSLYLAYFTSDGVSQVFAQNVVIDTIQVGVGASGVAYNPGNGYMYVANSNAATPSVSVINQNNAVVSTIPVGLFPDSLAYNPGNGYMYVTINGQDTVSVIAQNNTVVDTVSVGTDPRGIAYNPENGYMYVVNNVAAGSVSVIDQDNDVIDTVSVEGFPAGIAYNPDNGHMYVTNFSSDSVTIINQDNDIVETVSAGDSLRDIAYNPDNGHMYVTSEFAGSVFVIDQDANVVGTIPTGNGLRGIAYNPDNGHMYVTSFNAGSVFVINQENEIVETVSVQRGTNDVAYNPDNGHMYVTNSAPGTVSVIEYTAPPIADAGQDQTVESEQTVQLDGSGSSDPSGGTLTYQWTQTRGPPVALDDATSANPTFTAPETEVQENIVFELVVTNEQGIESEPDEVTIAVNPVISNPPPANGIQKLIGLLKNIINNPKDLAIVTASLNDAIRLLTDGIPGNDQEICSILKDFIPQIDSQDTTRHQIGEQSAATYNSLKCQ
jgi:YVTN family beta-propeller protein